jgi:hypothetical protein
VIDKIILVVLLVVAAYAIINYQPEGHVYDCRLAEISPDFPIQVKEECRRLRNEVTKNEREII